ncbi:unnamed protein product, partial [Closterium sp. Naga37s-1]
PVVVAEVKPALANKLIKQLASVAPLKDLHHVKRVRRTGEGRAVSLHVVLTPGSDPLALPESLQQLVTQHGLELAVAQVPAHAPRTKERWQEQQSVWPTSFHPPLPGSGAAAPPSTVTPATATYIQQCFRVIIEKAVNACEGRAGSEDCAHVTTCEVKDGGRELRGEGDGGEESEEKGPREESVERGVREERQREAVDGRRKEEEGHGRGHQCGSCDCAEPLSVQHEGLLRPCCVEGFNMAVIADPSNGLILASAQNPAAPAARRIKKTRKGQGTTTTPTTTTAAATAAVETATSTCKQAARNSNPCASNDGRTEKSARTRLGHPLGHAMMIAIAAAAARDRALFPSEAAQDKAMFMDGGGEESGERVSRRGGSEAALGEDQEREGEHAGGEQRELQHQRGGEQDEGGEEVRGGGVEVKGDGKSPPFKRQKGNDVSGGRGVNGGRGASGGRGGVMGGMGLVRGVGLVPTPSEPALSAVPPNTSARPAVSPNAASPSAVRPYLCTGFDAFLLHEPCIM